MPPKRTCDCGVCKKCRWREYMNGYYRRNADKMRAIVHASRQRRLDDVRAYDRERDDGGRRRHTPQGRARRKAMNAVRDAIKRGELTPQPCEVCELPPYREDGRRQVEAHHEDYRQPLTVRWRCRPHHMVLHRRVAA